MKPSASSGSATAAAGSCFRSSSVASQLRKLPQATIADDQRVHLDLPALERIGELGVGSAQSADLDRGVDQINAMLSSRGGAAQPPGQAGKVANARAIRWRATLVFGTAKSNQLRTSSSSPMPCM